MPFNLSKFGLEDMAACGSALRHMGRGAMAVEDVAHQVVRFFYESLADDYGPQTVLTRFFVTAPFSELTARQQALAAEMASGPIHPSTTCLTLLATAGREPAWNDVRASRGHQAIPLPSPEAVVQFPMISQLIQQLGLDIAFLVQPAPDLVLDREQRVYNVLYVPEAQGSPHIPAQQQFVVPYQVRSVLGFGGVLPTGNIFAVIMFARVTIPSTAASMFKTIALNVKVALLPLMAGPLMTRES